ncbi:MAG TPA: transglycosylase family protein [Solirubrobacteraceae bacterium]|nr:transglycosylase family protein [Solirubrobacteraceae bacterium]
MRLRTLSAVCATCAATAPLSTDLAAAAAPAAAPTAGAAASPPPIGSVTVPASLSATPTAAMSPTTGRSVAKTRLVELNVFLRQRYEQLLGERLTRSERRHRREILHRFTAYRVRMKNLHLSHDVRELRARLKSAGPDIPIPSQLSAIAQCESEGDPGAVSASGTYRGKYQFSLATWRTVGGTGDPAAASETEQDRRAALLYRRHGPGQWPVCGR